MGVNKLQTASDYDLRYRYLRMHSKATASDFTHLDSIFIMHRNSKAIQQMQQKVVDMSKPCNGKPKLLLQEDKIKARTKKTKEAFEEIANVFKKNI